MQLKTLVAFGDHSYNEFILGFFFASFWQCIIGWYCAWAWEWKCSLAIFSVDHLISLLNDTSFTH